MEDKNNCKLNPSIADSATGKCSDKGLATQCEAMLQGKDRMSRFENWRAYLEEITHSSKPGDQSFCDVKSSSSFVSSKAKKIGGTCSKVFYVPKCDHDFDCIMKSSEAQCLLFDYCAK